jgi:hypothetical protein
LFNDTVSTSDNAVSNHRVINDELVKIWKESFVTNLRYSPGGFLQRLRKTTRNLRLFSVPALFQRAHAE